LVDFEAHLTGKTQFLLDAILGFINTERHEIFKVLTIVSVVGIPATLIASMYGMNSTTCRSWGGVGAIPTDWRSSRSAHCCRS
jgi:magnesium transporter